MAESEQTIQGQCLCGGVKFEADLPAKWCAHCHCTFCRRAHGAPFVTWAGFAEERVRMLAGEDLLVNFKATPQATRSFCRACGGQIFFQGDRWPGEIHIARALLEETADLRPTAHSYFSDKASWMEVPDSLPKRGGESGIEPLED